MIEARVAECRAHSDPWIPGRRAIDPEIEQSEVAQDAVEKLLRESAIAVRSELASAKKFLNDRVGEIAAVSPVSQRGQGAARGRRHASRR